jgi:hypothetical protein
MNPLRNLIAAYATDTWKPSNLRSLALTAHFGHSGQALVCQSQLLILVFLSKISAQTQSLHSERPQVH